MRKRLKYLHNMFIYQLQSFSSPVKVPWKHNIFSGAALNCLAKCFGQPPPDALVKIEITLASTINVARPLYIYVEQPLNTVTSNKQTPALVTMNKFSSDSD